jgi:hypothetical protein
MKKTKDQERKVYTFYGPISDQSPESDIKLMLLWKRAWEKQGFTPIVLNENHASKHDLWQFFKRRIETLPSVNVPRYEFLCYARWMAMAAMGGGIMTDYDVQIYSVPEELTPRRFSDQITLLQSHIPSVVIGSRTAYEDVVKQMLDYKVTEKDIEEEKKLPHVSDMYMFYRNGIKYEKKEIVKNFGDEGWESAALVHFANSSLRNHQSKPRHEVIPQLRAI